MIRKIFTNILTPLATVGFALLFVMERRRPLRERVSSTPARLGKNLALGAVTSGAIQLLFLPAITATARVVERRRLGILGLVPLPEPVRIVLAMIAIDYTYYWWHRMLHRVPLLWRFHAVHHTDLDLDVSTATRFHVGEWLLTIPFRVLQTLVIGAPEAGIAAFEIAMILEIMFHHSNLRLSRHAEGALRRILVTPRLHGIHHSVVKEETDSNFATLLPVWDRLHGTFRPGSPWKPVIIGLAEYRSERELNLGKLLALPFGAERTGA